MLGDSVASCCFLVLFSTRVLRSLLCPYVYFCFVYVYMLHWFETLEWKRIDVFEDLLFIPLQHNLSSQGAPEFARVVFLSAKFGGLCFQKKVELG